MEYILIGALIFVGLLVIATIFYLLVTFLFAAIYGMKRSEAFRFIRRGMRR